MFLHIQIENAPTRNKLIWNKSTNNVYVSSVGHKPFLCFQIRDRCVSIGTQQIPTSKKINKKLRKMYTRFYIVRLTWTNILQSFGILLINICMYIVETNIVLFWGPTLIFYLCFHKFKITLMFIKIWQDIARISVATIYKASPLSFFIIYTNYCNVQKYGAVHKIFIVTTEEMGQRGWEVNKIPIKEAGWTKNTHKTAFNIKTWYLRRETII